MGIPAWKIERPVCDSNSWTWDADGQWFKHCCEPAYCLGNRMIAQAFDHISDYFSLYEIINPTEDTGVCNMVKDAYRSEAFLWLRQASYREQGYKLWCVEEVQ